VDEYGRFAVGGSGRCTLVRCSMYVVGRCGRNAVGGCGRCAVCGCGRCAEGGCGRRAVWVWQVHYGRV
jgi:hypothetical protein